MRRRASDTCATVGHDPRWFHVKRTRLRPVSRRRAREHRTRRKAADALMADGPVMCEWPGCTSRADDWHEIKSRAQGGSITDPENRACLCRHHHDYLTHTVEGRREAITLGLVRTNQTETP